MNEYCTELKKLYKEIPVYGYGTALQLRTIYMRARPIVLSIAASKGQKGLQTALGVSSVEIDNLISYANNAKTKKDQKAYFERAAEQLGEDIQTAMSLIECH